MKWLRACILSMLLSLVGAHASAGDLVVSAAASLATVLNDIKPRFEALHPGDRLYFNFAASGTLARQIAAGAPADVFISASSLPMDQLQAGGLIVPATRFDWLSNVLVLVVSPQGVQAIHGFDDLPQAGRVAMGDPGYVPAGHYARQTLKALHLWDTLQPKLVFGQDVRQVLEYVARGEVEAGLVFATDAALMPTRVKMVARAPAGTHEPIVYPMAVVAATREPQLARAFLAYLGNPSNRTFFEQHGFIWAVK